MATLTRDQKIAALAVPLILFGILGTSVAFAHPGRALSEEERAVVSEARELREAGDYEGAKSLLREAGIHKGNIMHRGSSGGKKGAVRDAVEANDFDAFTVAVQNTPLADLVTPDLFQKLVAAHELREAGDYEGAHRLMEEIGIPGAGHMRGHRGEYQNKEEV